MKKSKRVLFVVSFLVLSLFIVSQTGLAQGAWREKMKEKIKENIKERRSERAGERGRVNTNIGDYDFSFEYGGWMRTYKVHIPPSYKTTMPAPLILSFHGGGGDSGRMAIDKYYNLISKSNEEGFIVAFPNGVSKVKSGKRATWNAGSCCGYARDNKVDDVGFVEAMLEDIDGKYSINSNKVYAIGFSNGGMFSYRLACELTDRFAAIASVAGTENCDNCAPSKAISVMHIHAKDDGYVLFDGGSGDVFKDKSKVTNFTPVPETISRWVRRNDCDSSPRRVLEKEGVYCDLYSGCADNVRVMLCVTETGGHSWPGGQKPREKADTPSNAISAVDEIWEFFKSQSNE